MIQIDAKGLVGKVVELVFANHLLSRKALMVIVGVLCIFFLPISQYFVVGESSVVTLESKSIISESIYVVAVAVVKIIAITVLCLYGVKKQKELDSESKPDKP